MDGITEENVVAAYQFKGAESRESALKNINSGAVYPLTATNTVTWTTGKGLFFPATVDCYINNGQLVNQAGSIVSCAFGYSDMRTGNVVTAGTTIALSKGLFAKGGVYKDSKATYYRHYFSVGDGAGSTAAQSGVLYNGGVLAYNYGANSTSKLFHNGLALSTSSAGYWNNGGWTSGRVFTTCTNTSLARGTMYLSALVFYNCVLTDAQHVQLASQINAL